MNAFDDVDRDEEEPTDEDLDPQEEDEGGEPWAKTSSGDADEI